MKMYFSVCNYMMGNLYSLNNYLKYVKLLWLSMWSIFMFLMCLEKNTCSLIVECRILSSFSSLILLVWLFIFSVSLLYFGLIDLLLQCKRPSLTVNMSFFPYNSTSFYFLSMLLGIRDSELLVFPWWIVHFIIIR